MVHYLKIKNFGPINDEVEINFEVAGKSEQAAYEVEMADGRRLIKLAYIYGANASGKTSILEAFELLRILLLNPAPYKSIKLGFEPFLFCENPFERPSRFDFSFYVEGVRYLYEVVFDQTSIREEKLSLFRSAKPTELFIRNTDAERRLSSIHFGARAKVPVRERELLESNTLHNTTVIGAYARTNADIPALETLYKWLEHFFLGMVMADSNMTNVTASKVSDDQNFKAWMISFLNKADQQITDIEVVDYRIKQLNISFATTGNFLRKYEDEDLSAALKTTINYSPFKIDLVHRLDQDNQYSLPFSLESNGTKSYFGLGGPLYDLINSSHFLSIDEMGSSLHSDLMIHFLQTFLLNATDSQLLITTHDLNMLSQQDFIRWDALWFCEKKEDGSVNLYSAADFDSAVLRKGSNLANAYRAGRLGAKPNLGSPYLLEN